MSTVATPPEFSAVNASWDAVDRVCRRICLLRATGRSRDAAHLQSTELAQLLAALPAHPETESRLQARFAAEEARIAEAQLLADFLAPLVAAHLRADSSASTALHSSVAPPTPLRPLAPAPTVPAGPASPPGIADFIDEMLAQERPSTRPFRRAS